MPDTLTTTGVVRDGKVQLRNRNALDGALRWWPNGAEVVITIERRRATRSKDANAYYWGVVIELLSRHTGYTPDEMHELAKQMFLAKHLTLATSNGEICGDYVIGGSTKRLNTLQFYEYVERIRDWAAADLGVVIPDPVTTFSIAEVA